MHVLTFLALDLHVDSISDLQYLGTQRALFRHTRYLQCWRSDGRTSEMPASATARQAVYSQEPYTHQTLGQQRGTGEDGHIHLTDWILQIASYCKFQIK